MICYASHTTTRRNLAALRQRQWRLLFSPTSYNWNPDGFAYALDNGAWTCFQSGRDFDDEGFKSLVDRLGGQADWVAAPDVVAGGLHSLQLSLVWLPHLLLRSRLVLIPVQDGMVPADMVNLVSKRVGIFLGGSTEWKLANMKIWGEFCSEARCYYHVGRVNTVKRFSLAISSAADSVDGSSASRFSLTLPMLDSASRQWDMWAPPRNRDEIIAWAASPARWDDAA